MAGDAGGALGAALTAYYHHFNQDRNVRNMIRNSVLILIITMTMKLKNI